MSESYQMGDVEGGGGDSGFSGPVPVSASSSFAWAHHGTSAAAGGGRRKDDTVSVMSNGSTLDPSFAKSTYGFPKLGNPQPQDHVLVRVGSSKRESRKSQRNYTNHRRELSDFAYQSPEISHMGAKMYTNNGFK